jgi:hypothetical protein
MRAFRMSLPKRLVELPELWPPPLRAASSALPGASHHCSAVGAAHQEKLSEQRIWAVAYIKDPETGKRVSGTNPESEWITQDVPELRIIADDLWQAVKSGPSVYRNCLSLYERPM